MNRRLGEYQFPHPNDGHGLLRISERLNRERIAGYTANVADAGRYTEAEAKAEAAIEPAIMQAVHLSEVQL